MTEVATKPRMCFFIPFEQYDEHGYIPSVVVEREAGHAPLAGNGAFASPWYWGDTYEQAVEEARRENAKLGLTDADVAEIIASSMFAPPAAEVLAEKYGQPDTISNSATVNRRQAAWALHALHAYARVAESRPKLADPEILTEIAADLICDLMLLVAQGGGDPEQARERAYRDFLFEVGNGF